MRKLHADSGQKTVTTAGTKEVLAIHTHVRSVTIKALGTNGGNVYVGDSAVSSTTGDVLAAGDSIVYKVDNPKEEYISLGDICLDVDNNGEGVSYTYMRE